jgi:hypothetical protein
MVRIRKKLIVQSEQYGDGSSPKQNAQIQEQDFPINKFRTIKIKFETFDEIALQNDMGYQA